MTISNSRDMLRSLENKLETRVDTNLSLADRYADKGTVKHFALRLGFMPHDEEQAELIIVKALMDADVL